MKKTNKGSPKDKGKSQSCDILNFIYRLTYFYQLYRQPQIMYKPMTKKKITNIFDSKLTHFGAKSLKRNAFRLAFTGLDHALVVPVEMLHSVSNSAPK